MGRTPAVLVAVLALASCTGGGDPNSLEPVAFPVPADGAGVLVSVPLEPGRAIRVNGVEPVFDDGLDVRYVGFVTRCGGLCGITELEDDAAVLSVERAVEGTVPIETSGGGDGPHLLLVVRIDEDVRERLGPRGCLTLRRVDLELDDGEVIGVTRRGFQFLWVVAATQEADCFDGTLLVS